MVPRNRLVPLFGLALGSSVPHATPAVRSRSLDVTEVRMRAPDDVDRMRPQRPKWKGRASVTDTTLVFDFPAIETNNVGCNGAEGVPPPARRRYYWIATAAYPGSHYPRNHFQQVALDFSLPDEAAPTRARLDSAFGAQRIRVGEAAGEPPMTVRTIAPERLLATLERTTLGGRSAWRVRVVVEGKEAVRAFLSAGADSVSLSWCQRDQRLTYLPVRMERL